MIGRICRLMTNVLLGAVLLAWPALAAGDAIAPGMNLAAGLRYEVDPAPNYPGAGDARRHVATDRRKSGLLFAPADAIGWSRASPVTITLDLQRMVDFDQVTISSVARPKGELHHPAQAILFAGAERNLMRHVTDLAPDDHAETNGSKSFHLPFATIRARFLVIVLYPKGDFLLIDEIEVRSAQDGVASTGELTPDDMRKAAAHIRSSTALAAGGPIPIGAHPARRWAAPLPDIASGSGGCEIRRIDPWDDFRSTNLARLAASKEKLVAAMDGPAQAAWLVINRASAPAPLEILQAKESSVDALSFVQAADLSWIADAPSPFRSWIMPPRSAMILFTTAGTETKRSGVSLACAGETFDAEIEIDRVAPAPDEKVLSGSLWPYLRGPAAPGACGRDLLDLSGSDTAVIPPSALMTERAEAELRLYMRRFNRAKSIRLFMDLARPEWRSALAPHDRDGVAKWWRRVRRIADEEGVTGELTPYPFDEIKPADIPGLATFAATFRVVDPSARIFGTIDSPRSAEALKHLDIAQILDRPDVIRLVDGRQETHLYATKGGARSLSPYAYYRLQGWKAYARGWDGVGFWSMWETSGAENPGNGWSLFGGDERDYGVIYRDLYGCPMASRRLHAWRRGLEDHRILKACEARLGKAALASLVERVLAKPDITSAADEALAAVSAQCRN